MVLACGSHVEVVVEIHGTNVPPGRAVMKFDTRYLRLTSGRAGMKLPAGPFTTTLAWTLEAVEEVEHTWVEISVGPQLVGFNLRIPPLRRIV